jgi:hypothetical protein
MQDLRFAFRHAVQAGLDPQLGFLDPFHEVPMVIGLSCI